jgi:sugar lactone lactonase YvrE
MTKKRNWLGTLVLLAAFAVVAVGCDQISELLGVGSEKEPDDPNTGPDDPNRELKLSVEVSTFAGTGGAGPGTGGYVNGSRLKNAQFGAPKGVAFDSKGNIYVSDRENSCIRKIDTNGEVTTFAGSERGERGKADGTGTDARFIYPEGVAVDSYDNVYVADTGSESIRKITPGGVVSTLSGFTLKEPKGVAVDGDDVYVADYGNNRILKISDGKVETLADKLSSPYGVAVDGDGNVYVSEYKTNHRIRKISPDGKVSTLAGRGPYGHADGTGEEAEFYAPTSVAVDVKGNVYVAEFYSHRIRMITPEGVVSTLAGGSDPVTGNYVGAYVDDVPGLEARFRSPTGVAVDGEGNVYVADNQNRRIRKLTITKTTR